MKKGRNASDYESGLAPKPPAILQHIKWFQLHGHKNKLLIFVALLTVIIVVSLRFHYWSFGSTVAETSLEDDEILDCVVVTFKDNVKANVDLYTSVLIDPNRIVYIVERYGDYHNALKDLLASIRNETIAILEQNPLSYVRQNRKLVEGEILKACEDDAIRTGYKIELLSISKIEAVEFAP